MSLLLTLAWLQAAADELGPKRKLARLKRVARILEEWAKAPTILADPKLHADAEAALEAFRKALPRLMG